jgi:hypothetical protein
MTDEREDWQLAMDHLHYVVAEHHPSRQRDQNADWLNNALDNAVRRAHLLLVHSDIEEFIEDHWSELGLDNLDDEALDDRLRMIVDAVFPRAWTRSSSGEADE